MCTSTSFKTSRTHIPLLNNIQQVNDNKIIFNDSNVSLLWFDKNTCLQNDEDVRETKQMLQEIQANVTFHSDLDNFIKGQVSLRPFFDPKYFSKRLTYSESASNSE